MANALTGFWRKLGSRFNKSDKTAVFGKMGIDYFGGEFFTEQNNNLRGQTGYRKFDEMRKTDGSIKSILAAMSGPLLSANWYIDGSENNVPDEIIEFVEYNLFKKLKFFSRLKEQIEGKKVYGFYYYEKIFGKDKNRNDGRLYWLDWEARHPFAHYKWEMANGQAGVQQNISSFEPQDPKNKQRDGSSRAGNISIPAEKLILLTNEQEGGNLGGVSMLRSGFIHWRTKNLLYQVQEVGAERWGVGFPLLKVKTSLSESKKSEVEEWLGDITSGRQTYAVIPDEWDFELVSGAMAEVQAAIDHHDRQLVKMVLADFLNVGSTSTGSFAMVEKKINFFEQSLEHEAREVVEEYNKHIEELVKINFGESAKIPFLEVNKIKNENLKEMAETLKTLADSGFLDSGENDVRWTRDFFGLPEESRDTKVGDLATRDKKKKTDNDKESYDSTEIFEQSKKKNKVTSEIKISEREKKFVQIITENERSIQQVFYSDFIPMGLQFEQGIRKDVQSLYRRAKTKKVGKQEVLVLEGNGRLIRNMFRSIDRRAEKWQKRVFSKRTEGRLFKPSIALAQQAIGSDIFEASSTKINSFIRGFASNVKAVVDNSARQIKEAIEVNFAGEVPLDEALKQVKGFSFNRNIYKLAAITHARALFKKLVYDKSAKDGYEDYKMVIPDRLKIAGQVVIPRPSGLKKDGKTASWLWLILAIEEWQSRVGDDTPSPITGLGIHHNSFDYYLPIKKENLEEEKKISRLQRKKLKNES